MKTKVRSKSSSYNEKEDWSNAKQAAKQNDFLQTAIAIGRIHTLGNVSPKEIVEKGAKNGLKISLPHVYNYIKISALPAKIQAYIQADQINATDVLSVIHKHQTEKELLDIVHKMVSERQKEASKNQQQKTVAKRKNIQERFKNFLSTHNIVPNEKDLKALMSITGKYVAA